MEDKPVKTGGSSVIGPRVRDMYVCRHTGQPESLNMGLRFFDICLIYLA